MTAPIIPLDPWRARLRRDMAAHGLRESVRRLIDVRLVLCEACGSEGRIYGGHPNDPHPRDEGQCPCCEGTGLMLIDVEPAAPDGMAAEDAEAADGLPCDTEQTR